MEFGGVKEICNIINILQTLEGSVRKWFLLTSYLFKPILQKILQLKEIDFTSESKYIYTAATKATIMSIGFSKCVGMC